MPENWISAYRATAAIGVTARTLRNWEARGFIRTKRSPTGHRLYDLSSYVKAEEPGEGFGERFIYARVSSVKQKDDLDRQVQSLTEKYPGYRVVRDIGSGINWKRPGLRTLVRSCLEGTIREVVVAHRDRLSRLAFDLLEYLVEQGGGKITVVGSGDRLCTADELGEDLLSIVHVFSSRHYGLRSYRKKEEGRQIKRRRVAPTVPEGADRADPGPEGATREGDGHSQVHV